METSPTASRLDWVAAIGYQHEVVHSAVLRHLLVDPDIAPSVAQALLTDQALRVKVVGDVGRELRIGPSRNRPIDLAADLTLEDGCASTLGVEVKVDSAWSRGQLESIVAPGDQGVLLAVGCTALAATEAEMPEGWRLVGPDRWASIVAEHAGGDRELERYAEHVRREDQSHRDARERVKRCLRVDDMRPRSALEHWRISMKLSPLCRAKRARNGNARRSSAVRCSPSGLMRHVAMVAAHTSS